MPAESKTLSQTIRDTIGEPVVKAQQTSMVQTAQGLPDGTTGETQSGGTPEYVSGVDISTLPEQERTVARKVLAEKGKLIEKGYQPKFAEVAEFKKQREQMLALGVSEQEAVEVIRNHVLAKTSAKDAKKEVSRVIDQLKESAPDLETRKGLENLEAIVKELTNIDDIRKELDNMKKQVGYFQNNALRTREEVLGSSLASLEKEYGKDVIEKYRDDVIREGLKYTDAEPERLLHAIGDPKELRQAILLNSGKKDVRQQEKTNAITSPTSGMASSSAQEINVKTTPMKSLLSHISGLAKK